MTATPILHFPDWPNRVMRSIEHDPFPHAVDEVLRLCNFTLKVQADDALLTDTRRCVLALWARCEREGAK